MELNIFLCCLIVFFTVTLNQMSWAEPDITLEKRFTILEQKFNLQYFDISLLRQELNREKQERAILEKHVNVLTDIVKSQNQALVTSDVTTNKEKSEKKNPQSELTFALLHAFNKEKTQRVKLKKQFIKLEADLEFEKERRVELEKVIMLHMNIPKKSDNDSVEVENMDMPDSIDIEKENLKQSIVNLENNQAVVTGQNISDEVESLKNSIDSMKRNTDELENKYLNLDKKIDMKIDELETNILNLKKKTNELEIDNNNHDEKTNRLEAKLIDLEQKTAIVNINYTQKNNNKYKVSFSAKLSKNIDNIKPWKTIIFQDIIINQGNAYSERTGEFTAPVSGTYVLYTHILGGDNKSLKTVLKKNGSNKMALFSKGPDHGSDSNMVILKLKTGDKVKVVKHGPWGQRPFYVHAYWSTFSGFLLYPD